MRRIVSFDPHRRKVGSIRIKLGAPLSREEALGGGRVAYAAKSWFAAWAQLSGADGLEPLGPADLEILAEAAFLVGKEVEAVATWIRAHQAWLAEGESTRAVRPAFWVALTLELRGDQATAYAYKHGLV